MLNQEVETGVLAPFSAAVWPWPPEMLSEFKFPYLSNEWFEIDESLRNAWFWHPLAMASMVSREIASVTSMTQHLCPSLSFSLAKVFESWQYNRINHSHQRCEWHWPHTLEINSQKPLTHAFPFAHSLCCLTTLSLNYDFHLAAQTGAPK